MEIQVFKNEEFGSVRTVNVNNEVMFVGKDVADILGYSNPRDALSRHVDLEDRADVGIHDGSQTRAMTAVNESGLYSLILSSKLPSAKKFKHWVTAEVLPSIRKHGLYAVDEVLSNPDVLINALTQLKAERAKNASLSQTIAVQNQQISEMKSKASYYDVVLNCKELIAISVIAKDYGWSANRMNKYLNKKGIQYRQGDSIWLLYQKYAGNGYTSTKTHSYPANDGYIHTKIQTQWTQKGRLFIYEHLKSDNILPLIEQE